MAEDGASEADHVCSCGISFGSILDPPNDNACGPQDHHKDWGSTKTIKRRIGFETCIGNDWGPGNISNPETLNTQNDNGAGSVVADSEFSNQVFKNLSESKFQVSGELTLLSSSTK